MIQENEEVVAWALGLSREAISSGDGGAGGGAIITARGRPSGGPGLELVDLRLPGQQAVTGGEQAHLSGGAMGSSSSGVGVSRGVKRVATAPRSTGSSAQQGPLLRDELARGLPLMLHQVHQLMGGSASGASNASTPTPGNLSQQIGSLLSHHVSALAASAHPSTASDNVTATGLVSLLPAGHHSSSSSSSSRGSSRGSYTGGSSIGLLSWPEEVSAKCVRILPGPLMEGFFIAKFVKKH